MIRPEEVVSIITSTSNLALSEIHRIKNKETHRFCLFIAPDGEESYIDMPKIRNSVEFVADVSTRVISFINKSKSDNTVNTILSSDELLQLMKQFTEVQSISRQIGTKSRMRYNQMKPLRNALSIIDLC